MHCNNVSFQVLLDCFHNNLERIMHRSWSVILNGIMQGIMNIITLALYTDSDVECESLQDCMCRSVTNTIILLQYNSTDTML